MRRRPDLADPVHIHDHAPVDPDKLPRIQPRFDLIHRFPQQVLVSSRVDIDVVIGGFDPVDLAHL